MGMGRSDAVMDSGFCKVSLLTRLGIRNLEGLSAGYPLRKPQDSKISMADCLW